MTTISARSRALIGVAPELASLFATLSNPNALSPPNLCYANSSQSAHAQSDSTLAIAMILSNFDVVEHARARFCCDLPLPAPPPQRPLPPLLTGRSVATEGLPGATAVSVLDSLAQARTPEPDDAHFDSFGGASPVKPVAARRGALFDEELNYFADTDAGDEEDKERGLWPTSDAETDAESEVEGVGVDDSPAVTTNFDGNAAIVFATDVDPPSQSHSPLSVTPRTPLPSLILQRFVTHVAALFLCDLPTTLTPYAALIAQPLSRMDHFFPAANPVVLDIATTVGPVSSTATMKSPTSKFKMPQIKPGHSVTAGSELVPSPQKAQH